MRPTIAGQSHRLSESSTDALIRYPPTLPATQPVSCVETRCRRTIFPLVRPKVDYTMRIDPLFIMHWYNGHMIICTLTGIMLYLIDEKTLTLSPSTHMHVILHDTHDTSCTVPNADISVHCITAISATNKFQIYTYTDAINVKR